MERQTFEDVWTMRCILYATGCRMNKHSKFGHIRAAYFVCIYDKVGIYSEKEV